MTYPIQSREFKEFSLTERAKENWRDHKEKIAGPAFMGSAALALSLVFLVSNPFGWTFSATLVGLGIAFAALNAIAAVGYAFYQLLKEPRPIQNTYTDETFSSSAAPLPPLVKLGTRSTDIELASLPKATRRDIWQRLGFS